MAERLGYKRFLGIGEESPWGDAVARTKFLKIHAGDGFAVDDKVVSAADVYRISHDTGDTVQGRIGITGGFSFDARWEGWELLLKAAMGAVSSAEQTAFVVTLNTNDKLDFKEDAGAELNATLTAGSYAMGTADTEAGTLCAEIKTQLEATGTGTYTVTYSRTTKKITIAVAGAIAATQFLWKTGVNGSDNTDFHAGGLIGFNDVADGSSVASVTGDNEVEFAMKHTFTMADELTNSLTLEDGQDETAFVGEGCMLNTITFNITADGLAIINIGIVGEDVATGTPEVSPTFTSTTILNFSQAVLTRNGSLNVKDTTITINNALSTDRSFIGSRLIKQPIRGAKREVTGTIATEFAGVTEYDDFRAATDREIILTFTGATINGAVTYELKFTMTYTKLMNSMPDVADEGVIQLPLDFKAFSSGATKEIQIELTNQTVSV